MYVINYSALPLIIGFRGRLKAINDLPPFKMTCQIPYDFHQSNRDYAESNDMPRADLQCGVLFRIEVPD
jgi:hypothetical protein